MPHFPAQLHTAETVIGGEYIPVLLGHFMTGASWDATEKATEVSVMHPIISLMPGARARDTISRLLSMLRPIGTNIAKSESISKACFDYAERKA